MALKIKVIWRHNDVNITSFLEIESSSTELPVQDTTGSEPEVTGTVTPQSSESKESEWTNVDKSESDDWEQEFDEINETTKVKTPGLNPKKNYVY